MKIILTILLPFLTLILEKGCDTPYSEAKTVIVQQDSAYIKLQRENIKNLQDYLQCKRENILLLKENIAIKKEFVEFATAAVKQQEKVNRDINELFKK